MIFVLVILLSRISYYELVTDVLEQLEPYIGLQNYYNPNKLVNVIVSKLMQLSECYKVTPHVVSIGHDRQGMIPVTNGGVIPLEPTESDCKYYVLCL